jgi:hypothetical protein
MPPKTGSSGPAPAGSPATVITVTAPPSGRLQLQCGQDVDCGVRLARNIANCTGFDFNEMYDLAEAIIDQNLLPATCTPSPDLPCRLFTRIIGQVWTCATHALPGGAVVSTAEVSLAKRAYCAKEGPPETITRPTAVQLRQPGGAPFGGSPADHSLVEGFAVPACGGSQLCKLVYHEQCNCDSTNDFTPHIQRARARVAEYGLKCKCPQPCVPRTEEVQHSYSCDGQVLRIDVFFNLICAQPAPVPGAG